MNQTAYISGPKCFGTSARNSWFDPNDPSLPGPGSHNSERLNKTNPPQWKIGSSSNRNSFLHPYHIQYPTPYDYNANQKQIMNQHPQYSIPQKQRFKIDKNIDQNNSLNYQPKYNKNKYKKSQQYSFGYIEQRNYSNIVPSPNNYQQNQYSISSRKTKNSFNKKQYNFTQAIRPTPYGQKDKYPGIGKYQINKNDKQSQKYSFGNSNRPEILLGKDAPGLHYNISNQIKKIGKGITMGHFYQRLKNNDIVQYPAPNYYNSNYNNHHTKVRNIITYQSNRSNMENDSIIKNPSPQKYHTNLSSRTKSQSFTNELKNNVKYKKSPGPCEYNTESDLNDNLGYMGKKIIDPTKFITPAGSNYTPLYSYVKQNYRKPINYYSNRSDFSKSVTGNKVGPGLYDLNDKQDKIQLGKMGTSLKFKSNHNKNPGPGFYQIPTSIGRLPQYYSGNRKITTDGFSIYTLEQNQKHKWREQKIKKQQKIKQEQQKNLILPKQSNKNQQQQQQQNKQYQKSHCQQQ